MAENSASWTDCLVDDCFHIRGLNRRILTSLSGFKPAVFVLSPGRFKAEGGGETSAAIPGDETRLQLRTSCECCAGGQRGTVLLISRFTFVLQITHARHLNTATHRSFKCHVPRSVSDARLLYPNSSWSVASTRWSRRSRRQS